MPEVTQVTEATCADCGFSVVVVRLDGKRTCRHTGVSLNRGCRAASFDRDGTWDDSLDRSLYATPKRDTERPVPPERAAELLAGLHQVGAIGMTPEAAHHLATPARMYAAMIREDDIEALEEAGYHDAAKLLRELPAVGGQANVPAATS